MHISGIKPNNSQNFQATHFSTKEMRRAFINGNQIVDMFKQEKSVIDEMSKDIDLYFFAGHSPKNADPNRLNAIKVMAVDTARRPSSATTFTYAYLIQPDSLTRTAREAIEKLNKNELFKSV